VLLGAAVGLPLLLVPSASNLFDLPKAALLRLLVICLSLLLYRALLRAPRWRDAVQLRQLTPVSAALGLVTLTWLVAALLGVDRLRSLFGSYYRQFGVVTFVCLFLLALVAERLYQSPAARSRLILAVVATAGAVALYGLLQFVGLDPLRLPLPPGRRVVSTLGQPNVTGGFLAMALPLTLSGALAARLPRRLSLLSAVTILPSLLLTQSRGAWVGAALGLAATVLLVWRGGRRPLCNAALLLLGAVALILGATVLLQRPTALEGRLRQELTLGRTSTSARLAVLGPTVRLIQDRPILGYGPETMDLVFDRVYPPALARYEPRQSVTDRADNEFLDAAISAGIAGVLAMTLWYGAVAWAAWRSVCGARSPAERWQRAGIAGALAAYMVQEQFGFASIAVTSTFVLLTAVAAASAWPQTLTPLGPPPPARAPGRLPYRIGVGGAVLLVLLLVVRPLAANAFYDSGLAALRQSRPAQAAVDFRVAGALAPLEPSYDTALANAALAQTGGGEQGGRDLHFAAALRSTGMAITAAPLDAHGRLNLALVLANWSLHGHPELRPRVEQSFARAVQASPFRGYYRRDWGQYEAAAGHAQAAQAQYAAAIALDDGDPASYRGLGEALLAAGNPAGARTAFLASLRLDPWQPDLQRRITLLASLSAP